MLHSSQICLRYEQRGGSLHSMGCICWKQKCEIASSLCHWEKTSNPPPSSPEPFSHPAEHLPAVPDVRFLLQVKQMEWARKQQVLQDAAYADQLERPQVPKHGEGKNGQSRKSLSLHVIIAPL